MLIKILISGECAVLQTQSLIAGAQQLLLVAAPAGLQKHWLLRAANAGLTSRFILRAY